MCVFLTDSGFSAVPSSIPEFIFAISALLRVLVCLVWSLAAQNRESRIARFPESRAWNRQKFRSEKQKHEPNRSKVESQKIDSESPSESHPCSMLKATLESHGSNRSILNSESPIQCH